MKKADIHTLTYLYQRAAFGAMPEKWEKLTRRQQLGDALDQLFEEAAHIQPLKQIDVSYMKKSPQERNKLRNEYMRSSALAIHDTNLQWLNQMADPKVSGLREKMTLFWHGHFATHIRHAHSAVNQINMFRAHALGNFRDLLKAACKDPALLHYLNANANKKNDINENFGRELLELFTLGIGHYTQKDVVEASRAFTGWTHQEHYTYVFNARNHDEGRKTFLGMTGNLKGEEVINRILEQKQTARFIAAKLYRYFVNDKVDTQKANELGDYFFSTNYDIQKLVRRIFESSWFYDQRNRGAIVKPPIELLANMMRVFHIQFQDAKQLYYLQRELGQMLFQPPNVAGWPGGRTWINNLTIYLRLNLARYLAQSFRLSGRLKGTFVVEKSDPNFIAQGLVANPLLLQKHFCEGSLTDIQQRLIQYLMPVTPKPYPTRRMGNKKEYVLFEALTLMGLPEYQVG